ncbi:hypothetical protein [Acidiphilium sp. PM]|uniref:hypothetical protein n=1 Tax=Acidiphilium sp. PM TaxID=1043206 RepID=UPI0002144C82|nr:hypothetical protein [Acidiphilium sp. PM]EGO96807.1 Hypothetical protein APM_0309 [Acidiphilium sp. PM]
MNRRRTLKAAVAGAAAAIAAPAVAYAAGNPDARFIADCDEFVALQQAELRAFEAIKDDDERNIFLTKPRARQTALIDSIWATDQINTPEGARAAARVILAWSDRTSDGKFMPDNLEDAVALTLASYLTGGVDPMAGIV